MKFAVADTLVAALEYEATVEMALADEESSVTRAWDDAREIATRITTDAAMDAAMTLAETRCEAARADRAARVAEAKATYEAFKRDIARRIKGSKRRCRGAARRLVMRGVRSLSKPHTRPVVLRVVRRRLSHRTHRATKPKPSTSDPDPEPPGLPRTSLVARGGLDAARGLAGWAVAA